MLVVVAVASVAPAVRPATIPLLRLSRRRRRAGRQGPDPAATRGPSAASLG